MFGHLSKAFGQLSDPATRKIFWLALGLSLATFIGLWILAGFGLSWGAGAFSAWLQGMGVGGWILTGLEWLAAVGSVGAVFLVSFLLFPAVIAVVLSFLLDDVCRHVEARHYPGLPPAREQPLWEAALDGARLLGVTVGLNILFLPLYLIPVVGLIVFYGLNGYLLGREYFEIVAVRRMAGGEQRALRRAYSSKITAGGVIVAILLTIPLVNLIMPLVATAFMVHLFEDLRRRSGSRQSPGA